MSNANIKKRMDFAKKHMTWKTEWQNIIWTDEKKFNLDGPDGFAHYWHDLRKDELIFSKRQQGIGGVMIWEAFGWNFKSHVTFVDLKMDSISYQKVLKEHIDNIKSSFGSTPWLFMQDNAPIHKSKSSIQWLNQQKIEVLPWPPQSPDLNPIGNVWGILARLVYEGGRQFYSIKELKIAILHA